MRLHSGQTYVMLAIIFIILLGPNIVYAHEDGEPHDKIYKIVGKNGVVTYTNIPPSPESRAIDTPGISIVPAPEISKEQVTSKPPAGQPQVYNNGPADLFSSPYNLSIAEPAHNETLRITGEPLYVDVEVEPELDISAGHQLQILIDGVISKQSHETRIDLPRLDRGSHRILARVVDGENRILESSDSITVFVQQPSALLDGSDR